MSGRIPNTAEASGERSADRRLLLVDDEPANLELFAVHFEDDYDIRTAANASEGLEILQSEDIGLILTDERMPGMSGIEFLARVAELYPDTIRIIVSAYGDADRLFRALNVGRAHEYVLKPWKAEEMRECVDRGLAMAARRRELSRRAELAIAGERVQQTGFDPGRVVGAEGGLAEVLSQARLAADSDATVLIRGETGTGKELVARVIHEASPRAEGPFVQVNCSALAEGLLQSELFGHERGAFTGAHRSRRGRLELASGGTILLDEIGDISPMVQVSLLRVLQERTIERVGGSASIHVDVRILAATNQDLDLMVEQGSFRADLFYRLNVFPLWIPPLRSRPEDIEPLVEHFVAKYGRPGQPYPGVSREAVDFLESYPWPGNVRELENLVHRAMILARGQELTAAHFNPDMSAMVRPTPREAHRDQEREQLRRALLKAGGNCSEAARKLDLPRSTLVSRAKKHGLL